MQEDREVLHNCFEQLANINTDITSAVYAGLNARMPAANVNSYQRPRSMTPD